ncbi:hypothetical protein [Haloarchaeobius iranensis]|uniref:Uncharacterized protein n=1 Tax=Haloarchaeobius iranensis TaxID=996166 RepID=A0A1G9SBB8_9EURY|nr:hypothetical protein [Haloarchaeobius iranensis]SDM32085.1 hypothetical protein SAMN05192554_10128 [Haloarchaeobius iranensis]
MPSTRDADRRWLLGELPRILLGVLAVLTATWFVETVGHLLLDIFESVFVHGLGLALSYELYGLLLDGVDLATAVVRWTGLFALGAYVVRRATA